VKSAVKQERSRRSSAPDMTPSRARSKSPAKEAATTINRAKSPFKGAAKGPTRPTAADRSFERRFQAYEDDYGQELRELEWEAYRTGQAEVLMDGLATFDELDDDQKRAAMRGLRRKEKEEGLRSIGEYTASTLAVPLTSADVFCSSEWVATGREQSLVSSSNGKGKAAPSGRAARGSKNGSVTKATRSATPLHGKTHPCKVVNGAIR
jgi:hypothetical protein